MTGQRAFLSLSSLSFLLLSLLVASVSAEVLFGPVTVPNGQVYTGTFPMYCRCTSYFLEVTNQSAKVPKVLLNGAPVLELGGEEWRKVAVQVELREDAPNEIEIRVGRTDDRAGAVVQVVERDMTPEPMPGREYVKDSTTPEEYIEMFVLNHWASRFVLRVENGDPDGSHRVTSGTVRVNGQVVLGPDQVHGGVAEAEAEVELWSEGLNRIRTRVEGPAGAKIRLGIEEPAQTVTVTEVACATPPGMVLREGIGTFDGELLFTAKVRGRQGDQVIDKLVEIDGEGAMREVVAEPETRILGMSPNGGYVFTHTREGSQWTTRFLGPDRAVLAEPATDLGMREIADNGSVVIGLDMSGGWVPHPGCGTLFGVWDPDGTALSLVPASPPSPVGTSYLCPDGHFVWARCDGKLSVYRTQDGSLAWERDDLCRHALANGGRAVQATRDTLFMIGAEGSVERRVINDSSPVWDCGATATTPDGAMALHNNGAAIVVARRWGPQSCWKFVPGIKAGSDLAEDGRWVLVESARYGPGQILRRFWLLGEGGQVVWVANDVEHGVTGAHAVTSAGFAHSQEPMVMGPRQWHVHRIDVE